MGLPGCYPVSANASKTSSARPQSQSMVRFGGGDYLPKSDEWNGKVSTDEIAVRDALIKSNIGLNDLISH